MSKRPSRDVMRAALFDDRFRPVDDARQRMRRAFCERREHTMIRAVPTPFGWFVAWRAPDGGWNYDWADQVTGYTEAICACRRPRRVDALVAKLAVR